MRVVLLLGGRLGDLMSFVLGLTFLLLQLKISRDLPQTAGFILLPELLQPYLVHSVRPLVWGWVGR